MHQAGYAREHRKERVHYLEKWLSAAIAATPLPSSGPPNPALPGTQRRIGRNAGSFFVPSGLPIAVARCLFLGSVERAASSHVLRGYQQIGLAACLPEF